MKDLKGTKTEANLLEAFSGEAQAFTKYLFYAAKAKKDGYVQIADYFEKTAYNEQVHAKIWFKLLHDGVPSTVDNLKDCIAGEHYETATMYTEFEKVAKEEGFDKIATLFAGVGEIEATHESRYRALLNNIEEEIVFKREEKVVWECNKCGHLHVGTEAPTVCPVCSHPQAYFEIHEVNY